MKRIIVSIGFVLCASGGVLYFLGNGENRNIGFNNGQCPRGEYVCGVTWK